MSARVLAGRLFFFAVIAGLLVGGAHAQSLPDNTRSGSPGNPPPDVGYEQRIGDQLPLDAVFTDETNRTRTLGDFFGTAPVVMVFGYFRCPQLCSVVSDATQDALRALAASPGNAYQFLYVSIDPTDTSTAALDKKRTDVRRFSRPGSEAAWHYLTGKEDAVRRLSSAAGFHYRYDPPSRQYAHASGFLVATPTGVISRYFLGIDFQPKELASALKRAEAGEMGDSVYQLLLLCIHGAGITGRYGQVIWRCLQLAVVLTVGGLVWGLTSMLLSERRNTRAAASGD